MQINKKNCHDMVSKLKLQLCLKASIMKGKRACFSTVSLMICFESDWVCWASARQIEPVDC